MKRKKSKKSCIISETNIDDFFNPLKESLRFLESEAPELRGLSSYFDDEFGDLKIPEETVKTTKISDNKKSLQQQVDSSSDDSYNEEYEDEYEEEEEYYSNVPNQEIDTNRVVKMLEIKKENGRFMYFVQRQDGKTEWIQEEDCLGYINCLKNFTLSGAENIEDDEEDKKEGEGNAIVNNGEKSSNSKITLVRNDQKEEIMNDVKRIIDVRQRNENTEYRVLWRVDKYKTKTAWIPLSGFDNIRGKYLIEAYQSKKHTKKKIAKTQPTTQENEEKYTKFWERFESEKK